MKQFNTSGPNIAEKHYTIRRHSLLKYGENWVKDERYFTIWAPRQTGKSTYFRQLAEQLIEEGYEVAHINFENYTDENKEAFLSKLREELHYFWQIDFTHLGIAEIFQRIVREKERKFILIIDEIEGINADYLGSFLHSIRSAYHSRTTHSLKSVILVGVSNIVGVIQDNASPFNITENLHLPYFSKDECYELLALHEEATGQLFDAKVKEKIYEITAGQPGLFNGFAYQLVSRYADEKNIRYTHYLAVEDWYLNVSIDKNVANIINKASDFRPLVERLLFTEIKLPFKIDREAIKILYTNGIIKDGEDGNVEFWVPLYKKRLYEAFYPYTNGEQDRIGKNIAVSHYISSDGKLNIAPLIQNFKEYIYRRGFEVFRETANERDYEGKVMYKSIPEAGCIYAFETYIQAFLGEVKGKSYREALTGLGRTDLIITLPNDELLIETKVFHGRDYFERGKSQVAYYCKHLGLHKGIYLIFIPENTLKIHQEYVKEEIITIEDVEIYVYLVEYEDEIPDYRRTKKK